MKKFLTKNSKLVQVCTNCIYDENVDGIKFDIQGKCNFFPPQFIVDEYEKKFSDLVINEVINSSWVSGVLEYLKTFANKQQFFIVTKL